MTPKITGYVVAEPQFVKDMIAAGWQPIGGVCACNGQMWQAMVKYEETPEPDPYAEELARLEAKRAAWPEEKRNLFEDIEKLHAAQCAAFREKD